MLAIERKGAKKNFVELREEVSCLDVKNAEFLCDEKCILKLSYLVDMFSKLNKLKL